jgi:uncharacterized cupin superfamily protein
MRAVARDASTIRRIRSRMALSNRAAKMSISTLAWPPPELRHCSDDPSRPGAQSRDAPVPVGDRTPINRQHGMTNPDFATCVRALMVPPRARLSAYPEPFASRMAGREKRALGDWFGLRNFGVNLTRLAPGAVSALRHAHALQDEFVYVLEGRPTLHTNAGATILEPGVCAGFRAGTADAHHLVNDTQEVVVYLEAGDRTPNDTAQYPDDDLVAIATATGWRFLHKDGTPY